MPLPIANLGDPLRQAKPGLAAQQAFSVMLPRNMYHTRCPMMLAFIGFTMKSVAPNSYARAIESASSKTGHEEDRHSNHACSSASRTNNLANSSSSTTRTNAEVVSSLLRMSESLLFLVIHYIRQQADKDRSNDSHKRLTQPLSPIIPLSLASHGDIPFLPERTQPVLTTHPPNSPILRVVLCARPMFWHRPSRCLI
jgi:hypothetical protein